MARSGKPPSTSVFGKAGALLSWAVLVVSLSALFAGYASGRSLAPMQRSRAHAVATPSPLPPQELVEDETEPPPESPARKLRGLHSLAASEPIVATVGEAVRARSDAGSFANNYRRRGRLAVVIDRCGASLDAEKRFAGLPMPIALAIGPDEPDADAVAEAARGAGQTVLVHLDLDAMRALDPAALLAELRRQFEAVPAAGGADASLTRVARREALLAAVGSVVKARGAFFLDTLPWQNGPTSAVLRRSKARVVARDVALEDRDDVRYVGFMLREAAGIATRYGSAVVVAPPRKATWQALRDMQARIERSGVDFVSVGELAS